MVHEVRYVGNTVFKISVKNVESLETRVLYDFKGCVVD